jgi:hypothetical protein
MLRYLLIPVFLQALVLPAPAAAADKSSGDNTAVRLSCFSITPPRDDSAACEQLCEQLCAVFIGVVIYYLVKLAFR